MGETSDIKHGVHNWQYYRYEHSDKNIYFILTHKLHQMNYKIILYKKKNNLEKALMAT